MEQAKVTISLKKEKFFNKIKNNYKTFLLFLLLFLFLGGFYSGITYKKQYQSSAAVYYRSYAPSSYIEQMASMANEKEVYEKTAQQLKQKQLVYDENDIKKMTTITMNESLHLVRFTIYCNDKENTQVICETFLNNALSHIHSNYIFNSTVLIMNHATDPIKYNNRILPKMILFLVIGIWVGTCNCLIKSKYNPTVGTMDSLFNLGINTIILNDALAPQKIAKEIQLIQQTNTKNYCIYVDSIQQSKNIKLVKEIASQLKADKKTAIVYLCKMEKKRKKSIQLEISFCSDFSNFSSMPEIIVTSSLYLLEEKKKTMIQNILNQFEIVFWIIEDNEMKSVESIEAKIDIIFVRKGITDLNSFINRLNQSIQSNKQPIIIYQ